MVVISAALRYSTTAFTVFVKIEHKALHHVVMCLKKLNKIAILMLVIFYSNIKQEAQLS